LLVFLLLQRTPVVTSAAAGPEQAELQAEVDQLLESAEVNASLPEYQPLQQINSVVRAADSHTSIPNRLRMDALEYTVVAGDSVSGIADEFNVSPETVVWANYNVLNDDPHLLSIGQVLKIPPTNGIWYQWKDGDTIEKISGDFKTTPEKILNWPGNKLDLTNPVIEPGTWVMLPDGWREFQQFIVTTIWRSNSGANQSIAGGCAIPEGGAYGTGGFIWPADNNYISGNDYWDGHLGIDIAAGTGAAVYAADSGVVVYAAPISGGYGNMVMIDHGNGYHTVYAHLSQFAVRCGQSVFAGSVIAYAGSTGNSTGPHLHFEVRYMGQFVNPWHVLP
jgi:murein DD-endopeptidase MepM/ murein hydrolase activator NlpD